MNESAEPRWECLPHDPKAFFGLGADFQRTELKRSYNTLIRKFKPEKAPQEFQRIRAAFESLDNQLRYGAEAASLASVFSSNLGQADFSPQAATIATPGQRGEMPESLTDTLRKRLKTESPKAIYQELRAAKTKTAEHYYALAVLSDICEPKKQMFLRWLLTGLQNFPKEPAFHNLLRAFFRAPMAKELAVKVLSNVASVLKGDLFYSISEPLWLQFVKQVDFKTFSKALAACEQKARSHQNNGRMVFYLQLLRSAMFVANEEWREQVAGEIENNHNSIPEYLESEMEITFALLAYRRRMKEFRNGNTIRGQMHATFVSYCSDTDDVAIRKFLECQSRISQSTREVFDAFPVDLDSDDEYVRDAWQMVTYDVARKLWLEPEEGDQDRYVQLLLKNLSELEQNESRSFWTRVNYGSGLWQLFAFGTAFFWPMVVLPFGYPICLTIGAICVVLYFVFGAKRVGAYAQNKREVMLEHAYRTRWRQGVQRMATAANGDLRLVRAILAHFTDEEYNLNVTPFLNGFVQHDLGLQILNDAKLFA